MPTIPIPQVPGVQRAASPGARVDESAAGMVNQANIGVAQSVANLGYAAAGVIDARRQYAERSLLVKNEGDVAKAQLEMRKAAADIEDFQASNADFNQWEKNATERIQKAQETIFKDAQLHPEVKRRLEQDVAQWAQDTSIATKFKGNRARDKDAVSSAVAAAQFAYDDGMDEAGDASIDRMASLGAITANEAATMKEKGRRQAAATQVAEAATAIEMVKSPRAQLEATQEMLATLANPESYKNLDKMSRLKAMSELNLQRSRIETGMERNALTILNAVERGEASLADLITAQQNGEIPDWVLMDGRPGKEAQRALSAGQQKMRDEAVRDLRAGLDTVSKLEKSLVEDYSKGETDIQLALDMGDITQTEANQLRSRLEVVTLGQRMLPAEEGVDSFGSISDELDEIYTVSALGLKPGRQPDPEEYMDLISRIHAAPLTATNREVLLKRVLEAKLADISDKQEEGTHWFWDRTISEPEVRMRSDLIRLYKDNVTTLGLQQTGALLLSQEAMIADFFENRKEPPTTGEVKEFQEQLANQVRSSSMDKLLESSFLP